LILEKIRLFSGEVSNDMVEMLKRRDELKFGDDPYGLREWKKPGELWVALM
jgi:hypothetical protein